MSGVCRANQNDSRGTQQNLHRYTCYTILMSNMGEGDEMEEKDFVIIDRIL